MEYFGDDRAWSEDSGPAPAADQLDREMPAEAPSRPTEVAPEELSMQHLGRYATVRWEDEQKYVIGKIVAVSGDSGAISVKLAGVETPVSFQRDVASDGPAKPILHVWI
ncbi:hypothetical protein [Candidatus Mycobacterium methanotrophicum]|uniref:Uncharacterized protein n=1 Tax=Candidatus Mycobacterium methanotrophicum TaxID=2943498 RepID=A0ABY4QLG4_9MYCO|nr:hypothetical protein [Candidatus Mycobacterium methanotrophicum]UQX11449.1 hypothetical protein M5I08_02710 [Candidatus Mycobacterium methanotrophicum]